MAKRERVFGSSYAFPYIDGSRSIELWTVNPGLLYFREYPTMTIVGVDGHTEVVYRSQFGDDNAKKKTTVSHILGKGESLHYSGYDKELRVKSIKVGSTIDHTTPSSVLVYIPKDTPKDLPKKERVHKEPSPFFRPLNLYLVAINVILGLAQVAALIMFLRK